MLRYNKTYQQRADAFAQEEAYEFALYVGHYRGMLKVGESSHDWLAFFPMYEDSRPRCEGFPQYILVDDEEVLWAMDGFDVMNKTYRLDNLAKGRHLYRELEKKYLTEDYSPSDDKDFISDLIYYTQGDNNFFSKQDAYLFLQEAQRLNRTLEIINSPHDGAYIKMI